MVKWADYLISEVSYDIDKKYIDEVKVHIDKGDKVGSGERWRRQDTVNAIRKGYSFCTIVKVNNELNRGEDVHIVEINSKEYIRTDKNKKESDNLGELPKFE